MRILALIMGITLVARGLRLLLTLPSRNVRVRRELWSYEMDSPILA